MTPSVNSIPERVWSALGRGCARLLLLAWLLPAVSAADSNYTEAEVKAAAEYFAAEKVLGPVCPTPIEPRPEGARP